MKWLIYFLIFITGAITACGQNSSLQPGNGDLPSISQHTPAGIPVQVKPFPAPYKKIPHYNTPDNITAGCPANIDFELNSFANWKCYAGTADTVGSTNVISVSLSGPIYNRHTIMPKTTPSLRDPYGLFPVNPPDGSNYCVRLGNDVNGAQAERIGYTIDVPVNAANASINFEYAVVFQDPGHTSWSQPRFTARLYDVQTNTYLPCASFEYIATSGLPGFQRSAVDTTVVFKTWSSVFINLSAYAGRTLNLEFTTADCARGAHWGYAYIDVGNCNQTASVKYQCAPPHTTTLTGPGGFAAYNWWDVNFSTLAGTGQNLVISPGPASATTFWVEVIPYNGYGCRDTMEVTIAAPSPPTANAGADALFCKGRSATIGSVPIPGNSYQWSPATYLSDPQSASPTANPPVSTTYILTATSDTSGCLASDTVDVVVYPMPTVAFSPNQPAQCMLNNNFIFTNNSTISSGTVSYYWTFGDGTNSASVSPLHSFASPGSYFVKLLVTSNNGCRDSLTQTVNVYPVSAATFTGNTAPQCLAGNSFGFTGTSAVSSGTLSYRWSFGDGGTSGQPNPVYSYTAAGTYIVKLIVTTNNGCSDSTFKTIIVHPQPPVNTINNSNVCKGDSIALTTTGAATYTWSPSQYLSCTSCTTPMAKPAFTTTYIVLGKNTFGCLAYDTAVLTVFQPFDLKVPADTICASGTTTLSASGAPLYTWFPAAGLSSTTIPNPVASPNVTTKYRVIGYDSNGCFKDTAYVLFIVNGIPAVELGPDLTLSTGTVVPLLSSIWNGPATNFLWSPATNLSCINCRAPNATVKNNITYHISITNIYGCKATDSINIKVFCEHSQVFIPDAFSPDGDGSNDILMVRGKGIAKVKSFRIFNRWGELVFERSNFPPNDPAFGWDGKIRGVLGAPVVYVYTAEVVCDNDVPYIFKGNTTLLR